MAQGATLDRPHPEIDEHRPPVVVDEDVSRGDVPVEDPLRVRVIQRLRELLDDPESPRRIEGVRRLLHVLDQGATDAVVDDIQECRVRSRLTYGHDVGVAEAAQSPHVALEAHPPPLVHERDLDDFDGDEPFLVHGIFGDDDGDAGFRARPSPQHVVSVQGTPRLLAHLWDPLCRLHRTPGLLARAGRIGRMERT